MMPVGKRLPADKQRCQRHRQFAKMPRQKMLLVRH